MVVALEHALAARFPSESQGATYYLQALPRIHLYSRIDLAGFTGDSGMPYRDVRDLYPLSVLGVGILLIACINFMNLATARSAIRAREIGLRKVVGARRQHIMGQFLWRVCVVYRGCSARIFWIDGVAFAPIFRSDGSTHLFSIFLIMFCGLAALRWLPLWFRGVIRPFIFRRSSPSMC